MFYLSMLSICLCCPKSSNLTFVHFAMLSILSILSMWSNLSILSCCPHCQFCPCCPYCPICPICQFCSCCPIYSICPFCPFCPFCPYIVNLSILSVLSVFVRICQNQLALIDWNSFQSCFSKVFVTSCKTIFQCDIFFKSDFCWLWYEFFVGHVWLYNDVREKMTTCDCKLCKVYHVISLLLANFTQTRDALD